MTSSAFVGAGIVCANFEMRKEIFNKTAFDSIVCLQVTTLVLLCCCFFTHD